MKRRINHVINVCKGWSTHVAKWGVMAQWTASNQIRLGMPFLNIKN